MKNSMEVKHLDFEAPLLSVRRFTAPASSSSTGKDRSCHTFYKTELNSGRNPGCVPFVWEQTPGQPKAGSNPLHPPALPPKLPPGRITTRKDSESSNPTEPNGKTVESSGSFKNIATNDDDAVCDAQSSDDSFYMNCSDSGSPDAARTSGCFSNDPEVRDFMMGRFLPAAMAMATEFSQCAPRKPPIGPMRKLARPAEATGEGNCEHVRPLSYGHKSKKSSQDTHEDSSVDGDDLREPHLSLESCGLAPLCLESSSYCPLNSMPGMKIRTRPSLRPDRDLSPRIKNTHRASLGLYEDEDSWEAVYRYKLGRGYRTQGDESSKLTSESNHLTYWSDSQIHDESSSCVRSTGGGISPDKGFLGVSGKENKDCNTDSFESFDKDDKNFWEIAPLSGRELSLIPSNDRTLCLDSVHKSGTISMDAIADTKRNFADNVSESVVECQKIEQSLVLDGCETDAVQFEGSVIIDPGLSSSPRRSIHEKMDHNQISKHEKVNSYSSHSQPLHPPTLLKSPTESWLSRTLPSVSPRTPFPHSLLAIQFQPRKQAPRAISIGSKRGTNGIISKLHSQQ